eukprot:scaffold17456_cov191-Amphora_coffeaeformis.AAC.2
MANSIHMRNERQRLLLHHRLASYQHEEQAKEEDILLGLDGDSQQASTTRSDERGSLSNDGMEASRKRFVSLIVPFLWIFIVITGVVVSAGAVVFHISQRADDGSASLLTGNIVQEPSQKDHNKESSTTAMMMMTTQQIISAKLKELDQHIEGTVWFADDAERFVEAASVWVHVAPPLAVVEAHNEADVVQIVPVLVELQQRYQLGFSIRAGGHHKAGYSTLPGGVVLSLKHINRIQLLSASASAEQSDYDHNNDTAIALIQPGARDEDYLHHLMHAHGYGGVFGYCPTVGLAGFAMGGGLGVQSRLYGLGLDQIVGAHIVLANGTLKEVGANQHADLLWALRGAGGGNFGVVTELHYRVVRAYDGLAVLSVTLPSPSFHRNASSTTSNSGDDEIKINLTVDFMSRLGDLEANNKLARNLVVMFDGWDQVNLIWSARDEETFQQGHVYMEDLVSNRMGPQVAQAPRKSVTIQWTGFYSIAEQRDNQGAKSSPWSQSVYKAACWYGFLHPENNTAVIWNKIMETFAQGFEDCPHLMIDVELWGGAIHDALPNETAFPYRSAVYNVGVLLVVPMAEPNHKDSFERESASVNRWWPEVQQYLTGSYLNYPTLSLGKDYPKAFWGENLPRLMALKRKFDPDDIFKNPLGVPMVEK